jgi:hypothetical protein
LSCETTEGIFVSWRFGDLEDHLVTLQLRGQVVIVAKTVARPEAAHAHRSASAKIAGSGIAILKK